MIKLDEFIKKNVEYFLGQNLFIVVMLVANIPSYKSPGSCEVQYVAKT